MCILTLTCSCRFTGTVGELDLHTPAVIYLTGNSFLCPFPELVPSEVMVRDRCVSDTSLFFMFLGALGGVAVVGSCGYVIYTRLHPPPQSADVENPNQTAAKKAWQCLYCEHVDFSYEACCAHEGACPENPTVKKARLTSIDPTVVTQSDSAAEPKLTWKEIHDKTNKHYHMTDANTDSDSDEYETADIHPEYHGRTLFSTSKQL